MLHGQAARRGPRHHGIMAFIVFAAQLRPARFKTTGPTALHTLPVGDLQVSRRARVG